MPAERVLHRDVADVGAPLPAEVTPRAGERWVLRGRRVDLEAAGCLVHFAGPLTIDVVGGSNVYVANPAGRRGVISIRNLVALWRREGSES